MQLSILCSVMRDMRTFLSITTHEKKKERKKEESVLWCSRKYVATNRKYRLYIDASAVKYNLSQGRVPSSREAL